MNALSPHLHLLLLASNHKGPTSNHPSPNFWQSSIPSNKSADNVFNGPQRRPDLNPDAVLLQRIHLKSVQPQLPNRNQSLVQQLLVQTPLLRLQDNPPLTFTIPPQHRRPIPNIIQSLPPKRLLRQHDPRPHFSEIHIASGTSIARRPSRLRRPSAGLDSGGGLEKAVEEEQVGVCAAGRRRW